jgi:hypothetical protein
MGHGLYFAESEGTAKYYRDELSRPVPTVNGRVAGRGDGKFDVVDDFGVQAGPFASKADAERHMSASMQGTLYKVAIKADRDHFLDWDKPLGEQSQFVQDALRSNPLIADALEQSKSVDDLYRRVGVKAGPDLAMDATIEREKLASKVLSEAGIPGIKYLDQGSRAGKGGTHNLVVFNDKHIEITGKDGKPVNAAPPASTGTAYPIAAGAAASDTRRVELVPFGLSEIPGVRTVVEKTSPMQRRLWRGIGHGPAHICRSRRNLPTHEGKSGGKIYRIRRRSGARPRGPADDQSGPGRDRRRAVPAVLGIPVRRAARRAPDARRFRGFHRPGTGRQDVL